MHFLLKEINSLKAHIDVKLTSIEERLTKIEERLPSKYLSIPEASKALGISVPTVRRGIDDGSIVVLKIGKRTLVDMCLTKPMCERLRKSGK